MNLKQQEHYQRYIDGQLEDICYMFDEQYKEWVYHDENKIYIANNNDIINVKKQANLNYAKYLVKLGADIHYTFANTTIMNHSELFKYLTDVVSMRNDDELKQKWIENTFESLSCMKHEDIGNYILDVFQDEVEKNKRYLTCCIRSACMSRNDSLLKRILNTYTCDDWEYTEQNLFDTSLECLRLCVEHGLDVSKCENMINHDVLSIDMLEFLIENGADLSRINVVDYVYREKFESLRYLCDKGIELKLDIKEVYKEIKDMPIRKVKEFISIVFVGDE